MSQLPQGDLARVINHDPNDDWPDLLEIRAVRLTPAGGRKVKKEMITADKFFGRSGYGAPMSGDELLRIVNKIRSRTHV
jgi:hypothetical protein